MAAPRQFGTIFRVNTNGTGFTNLYSFTNGSDGADPVAGLVLSGNTLYGTAQYGGDSALGRCSASAPTAPASTGSTVLAAVARTEPIPLPDWYYPAACFMERRSMETAMAFPMMGRCSG
jgi:hypothetical protein